MQYKRKKCESNLPNNKYIVHNYMCLHFMMQHYDIRNLIVALTLTLNNGL